MSKDISDCTKLVTETHAIIYGDTNKGPSANGDGNSDITLASIHTVLIQLTQMQTQMNAKLTNIENKNAGLESRLAEIEKNINKFAEINNVVSSLKSQVEVLTEDVQFVKTNSNDLESNMRSLGNIFDSVKATADSNTVAIAENRKNIDKCAQLQKTTDPNVRKELFEMREVNSNLQESIIDLKSRSMRDNLVFSGIHEERGENTEEILQEFIKRKFRIDYDVSFERVHRMGKWSEHNLYPRNIVAKFTYFKERELIRTRAPQKLKGSNVWVNEQFPPEIEERRKKLYPIMRLAKRDGKRVRLVKDLLYVNGELYDPEKDVSTQPERMPYSRVVNTGSRQPQKRPRHGTTPDRVR